MASERIRNHLHEMSEILFDNSENIKEGDYLKMMDITSDIHQIVMRNDLLTQAGAAVVQPVRPLDLAITPVSRLIDGLIRPSRGVVCEMAVIQVLMSKIQDGPNVLRAHLMAKTMQELVPICRKLCIPHSAINKGNLVGRITEMFVEHMSIVNNTMT